MGGGDADVREAGRPQALLVLGERQRTGDAPDVAAAFGALVGSQVIVRQDVGDAEAAAGPEDAVHLREHARLVRR